MKVCDYCEREYTPIEVEERLEAMFGPAIDEDYTVLIYGLCPDCWPELD